MMKLLTPAASIAVILLQLVPGTLAILPSGAIDVKCVDEGECEYTMFASQASFGSWLEMTAENNVARIPYLPPSDDPLLCLGSSAPLQAASEFIMVAPRGECTFEQKALNAQKLGASGLIIYGNLDSRYSLNSTKTEMDEEGSDIIYPREFFDYDCNKASAEIPIAALKFDQTPYDSRNDMLLSGTAARGNLCAYQNSDFEASCPSEKCLLTGNVEESTMKACCAWDQHIWLYKDTNTTDEENLVTIPALYLTMAEADILLQNMEMNRIEITMYSRYAPQYNMSSVIIWAWGTLVAAVAAWMSSADYRHATKNRSSQQEARSEDNSNPTGPHEYERVDNGAQVMTHHQEESLELGASDAIGFILLSSTGLLVLFFFQIFNVVKCFYAFGCAGAIFQVIFYPLFRKFSTREKVAFTTKFLELGPVSNLQIAAAFISYGLAAIWMYISFTQRHPDSILFFWVMQDIMGACMCIMFLSTIKLNSIRVACILLTAAFFYDIFFVFVTPYLTGGKSIMVDVATSGGPPKADPAWCEKYPDDPDCQGGDPLPMLFTIPRIGDYSGGSSMLGLGDIVLPGLLLSFAARFDDAKRFMGSAYPTKSYLRPLVVAYAVGLAMANIAVYAMQMGQPALLYLVPCCLGTMTYLGWKRGELDELWNTPQVIIASDKRLFGDYEEESTSEASNSLPIRQMT
mmetsp:Transcript_16173/g.24240  ORF Transcript_16173/g.24240 Transcript_16173/m.24240 type:complete len:687 (-) Transcript_16173:71-2131(-)